MNTTSSFFGLPRHLYVLLRNNQDLLNSLVKREISGRYKGSVMGLVWAFVNPILMLAVYTFVFSVVFNARWGEGGGDSKTEFALVLFAGLMLYNLFAECLNRAPLLITGNVNYVKKVVFPLELLSLVVMGNALFHFAISFGVWLLFYLIFFGLPPLTILWLPLLMLPFLLMVMGMSWFLASLGVYIRDVAQVVTLLVLVLMYLSPIFYPVSILPESFQAAMQLSPVTYVIEEARAVMIFGQVPNWLVFCIYSVISIAIFWGGYFWFVLTKKGFADVL